MTRDDILDRVERFLGGAPLQPLTEYIWPDCLDGPEDIEHLGIGVMHAVWCHSDSGAKWTEADVRETMRDWLTQDGVLPRATLPRKDER